MYVFTPLLSCSHLRKHGSSASSRGSASSTPLPALPSKEAAARVAADRLVPGGEGRGDSVVSHAL